MLFHFRTVFSSILTLGFVATITDVWLKLKSKEEFSQVTLSFPIRCLLCFSFYTNTIRLLKKDESPDSIKIFHGMKVITILWVILNHTYYYLNYQAFSSLLNAKEFGKEKAFQLIANGFLNVETFFFISAVLVSYGVMKMKEKRLNVFLYIFRRFWRNPKIAFLINGAIFVSGIIVSAVLNVYYDLHPTAIYVYNNPEDISYYIERGYFRTYLHCSTYCVGLTVGYLLVIRKAAHTLDSEFNWMVTCIRVVFDGAVWSVRLESRQCSGHSCFNSVHLHQQIRVVLSCRVTFACVTGNGGIAATVLSWEAFVPLGRLTYMTYLVHPIIQFVYIGSTRTLIRADHRTLVFMYFGNVVCAFMCAYVLSLLFESPFMALEKVFFSARLQPSEKTNKPKSNNGSGVLYDTKTTDCSDLYGDSMICAIKVKYYETSDT
ncbi:nose resistant to fluoxetine protein 6 [Trichonephila inaurata madagascariensis]|uniref:Nose resistant to fluoxetine protein 6 n=1 Tax=Trichonephila inaurata madagascariensis TaxID=2747483 RepID=A0A8X6XB05_9ARAC|nr:nose resistant to fluoxetine protein 6 [Trichonephila inaurata madagascariensis]